MKVQAEKELSKVEEDINKLEIRLNNPDFLKKAPQPVVNEHQQRLAELKLKKDKLEKSLADLRQE